MNHFTGGLFVRGHRRGGGIDAQNRVKVGFDVRLDLFLERRTSGDQDEATAQVGDHVASRRSQLLFVGIEKEIFANDRFSSAGRHFQRTLNRLEALVDRLFDRRVNVSLQVRMMTKEKNVRIDFQHRAERLKDRWFEVQQSVFGHGENRRGRRPCPSSGTRTRHVRLRWRRIRRRQRLSQLTRRTDQLFLQFLEVLLIDQNMMNRKILEERFPCPGSRPLISLSPSYIQLNL